MCVEKTRAYVKNNKAKLVNAVVGWGRPVYTGEENLPLLSKVGSSDAPVKTSAPVSSTPSAPAVKKEFKQFKEGAKGSPVKKIQEALGLKADGVFGPGTSKAVKDFQSKSKLPVTGIVDLKTYKAILK
jgi:peptidoglycan hydrolase-like protein with peptidoglycan-binding domain